MAELKDSADQFAKDLINQNIAGLMMAFTPNGMGQAMALQGQMASQPQPAGTSRPAAGRHVQPDTRQCHA